jgi:siroheme synthase-like protein
MEPNPLFPIFLKLNQLKVLLVGAGPVGLEKLQAILDNAPNTNIKIVAKEVLPEVKHLASQFPHVHIEHREYVQNDMSQWDMAIVAVNNRKLSEKIYADAKKAGILVNVADTPDLCDFYLGSIVQKGQVKIAISTNGKSPTMAKRLRQWLTEVVPDNIDPLLKNLYEIRNNIKGDFQEKVEKLDALTSVLVEKAKK